MTGNLIRGGLLLLSAALLPACGSGSPGDGETSGLLLLTATSPTTAFVTTPVGVQHSVVPIHFTLTSVQSASVLVAVLFSEDGGATFRRATPAYGIGSLSARASSPSGVAHTFLWNSLDDGVGAGSVVLGGFTSLGTVNPRVRVRVVPDAGTEGMTADFAVDNTMNRFIGTVTTAFPHSFSTVGVSETAEGDLVADAMRLRYGAQLAFQNGWGLREPLPTAFGPAETSLRRPLDGYAAGPPFDLVFGDVALTLPFGNRVVTRTVTGAQLWAVLEQGVSSYPANNNGFPQISGFRFTFKAGNPSGSRVLSVTLDGGAPISKDATVYTFATNDFVNGGGDFYEMLNDGQGIVRELLMQVVADRIEALSPATPSLAGRITVVP
ncbi:MAG TPA: 5'-nucleotidase [Planctomycetota bacterium]|jgi:hypothetical protein|nr:5'-nucleotidase [Planctomycetota bacterium]